MDARDLKNLKILEKSEIILNPDNPEHVEILQRVYKNISKDKMIKLDRNNPNDVEWWNEDERYCTPAESLEESLKQMKLMREGKLPKKTWDELFNAGEENKVTPEEIQEIKELMKNVKQNKRRE
jgi:hypothetical protein